MIYTFVEKKTNLSLEHVSVLCIFLTIVHRQGVHYNI